MNRHLLVLLRQRRFGAKMLWALLRQVVGRSMLGCMLLKAEIHGIRHMIIIAVMLFHAFIPTSQ